MQCSDRHVGRKSTLLHPAAWINPPPFIHPAITYTQVPTPRKYLGYNYAGVTALNAFLSVLICLHVYWMVRTQCTKCAY